MYRIASVDSFIPEVESQKDISHLRILIACWRRDRKNIKEDFSETGCPKYLAGNREEECRDYCKCHLMDILNETIQTHKVMWSGFHAQSWEYQNSFQLQCLYSELHGYGLHSFSLPFCHLLWFLFTYTLGNVALPTQVFDFLNLPISFDVMPSDLSSLLL